MRRFSSGLLALSLAAGAPSVTLARTTASPPAQAPAGDTGWATSFDPATLATHMDVSDGAYMVVPAGTGSPARDAAFRALVGAMRNSGKARVVMDAAAIGNVDALDDEAIVAKVAHLPVDRVVVLRVFEGGDGQPANAVATLYDKEGQAVSAFAVAEGFPLTAGQVESGAGAGVSEAAAEAVEDTVEASATPDEAMAEYEKKALHFGKFVAINSAGVIVASWTRLYRGKYDEPVRGSKFYDIIGRDDLKKKYRRRMGLKIGLAVGGTVVGVTVASIGLAAILSNSTATPANFGEDDPLGMGDGKGGQKISDAGAWAMFGTGFAVVLVGQMTGWFLKAHPIKPPEARKLVDEYNRKLRRKLGIPEPTAHRLPVHVGIAAGPSGGGLTVRGRF